MVQVLAPQAYPAKGANRLAGKGVSPPPLSRASSPAAPPQSPGKRPFDFCPTFQTADLAVGEEIGKGRFKHVCRGTLRSSDMSAPGLEVVVLRYSKSGESKRELAVLSLLARNDCSAPYVPAIFAVCDDRREMVILQEHALCGSVKSMVSDPATFTVVHKLHASVQVARAMAFLQSVRVVHADLSCRNLLLFALPAQDPAGTVVKVTDFGLALVLPEGVDSDVRKQPQATRWCAPETVAFHKLSYRSDIWALGATLWELYSGGETPWAGPAWQKRASVAARLQELANAVPAQDAPEALVTQDRHHDDEISAELLGEIAGISEVAEEFPTPEGCPGLAHKLILACLRADERLRPRFVQLGDAFEAMIRPEESPAEAVKLPQGAEAAPERPERPEPEAAMSWGAARGWEGPGESPCKQLRPGAASLDSLLTCTTPSMPRWRGCRDDEAEVSLFTKRCEGLREFLCSSQALQLLGEEAAIKAFKAFLNSAEARALRGEVDDDVRRQLLARHFGRPLDACLLQQALTPDVRMPMDAPRSIELPSATHFEQLRTPCTGTYTPPYAILSGVSQEGRWTLQSLVTPTALSQQHFFAGALARAAFEDAANAGVPCMLRDPDGEDVAAHNWLVVDHTTASPKRTRTRRLTECGATFPGSYMAPLTPQPSLTPTPHYTPISSWVPPMQMYSVQP